ncbi:MAG: M23 family metallopeptidase [Halanaerobium sp.]|nr:M23 family metallopeptidase [Halanaerobium sp.]
MRRGAGERFKLFFREKLTIKFIPHSKKKVRTLSISKGWLAIFVCGLMIYLASSTFLSHYFYDNYQISLRTISDLRYVQEENAELKRRVAEIGSETYQLSTKLVELEQLSNTLRSEIKEAKGEDINFDIPQDEMEAYVLSFFNQSFANYGLDIARGGGDELILQHDILNYLMDIEDEVEYLQARLPDSQEEYQQLAGEVDTYKALQAATPKIWPLADNGNAFISSNFGYREDPFTGQRKLHEGIDIGVWYGTPVMATAAGKVVFAGYKSGYGNTVIIEHGFGYSTLYAHNQRVVVHNGQWVKRAQVIAYSGNSGRSEGPHLHYEVRVNGTPTDPRKFFSKGD